MPEADLTALKRHLEDCERCRRSLEELAAERELWQEAALRLNKASADVLTWARKTAAESGLNVSPWVRDGEYTGLFTWTGA